jgi:hypothetical protein
MVVNASRTVFTVIALFRLRVVRLKDLCGYSRQIQAKLDIAYFGAWHK